MRANSDEWIGSIPGPGGIEYQQSQTLTEWMDRTGADAVIWTALPAKSRGHNGRVPSVDDATAYVQSLHGDERTRAEAYIRQTPASIRTPFRAHFETVLGWHLEQERKRG
ncbi:MULTISPECIES: hypothetical protein [unclassified Caballeronia]|uniref:hypothetical protein n=1 Tax=unclassified Caballeronia TaxID=2646786 RepID=UPI002854CDC7|nr:MULTISPECIES: hypothetical protein [unclassified Caballeronia]MDR5777473.1 hypothetical protein [Caballeronia sp. LZ002]MDR5852926.1 hypothetical protein [Caballeronia sp. LZ003]